MSASSVSNVPNRINLGSQQVTSPAGGALTTAVPVSLATLNLEAGLHCIQVSYTLTAGDATTAVVKVDVAVGSNPKSSDLVATTLPNGVAVNKCDVVWVQTATALTGVAVTLTPTFAGNTTPLVASNYKVAVNKIW